MVAKRYVSYDDMNVMLNTMYREMAIDGYKPDVVVGLVRGGAIPAVHFSHYFDVPMVAFKYSLRDHPGSDDFQKLTDLIATGQKILIVDDICDEGHTLHNIMEQIQTFHSIASSMSEALAEVIESYTPAVFENVKTAVLQHNLGATLFSPDYCGEEINKVESPVWVVYPFEY